MMDSDDQSPIGSSLIHLYEKLNESIEQVLLEFDWDDLMMLSLVYGDQLSYPLNTHIERMLSIESSEGETVH